MDISYIFIYYLHSVHFRNLKLHTNAEKFAICSTEITDPFSPKPTNLKNAGETHWSE